MSDKITLRDIARVQVKAMLMRPHSPHLSAEDYEQAYNCGLSAILDRVEDALDADDEYRSGELEHDQRRNAVMRLAMEDVRTLIHLIGGDEL